jgi:hypothetical protein
MLDTRFYAGPLGDLRPLPDRWGPVDTPLIQFGGQHISLTGVATQDIFGEKRTWVWAWTDLSAAQTNWVEAIHRRQVGRPMYLIDPHRPNRLPPQAATGGSVRGTPAGFVHGNTSVGYWRPMTSVGAADIATLAPAPVLRGCLEWSVLVPGAASLEVEGRALDGRLNIPLRPGEVVEAYAWLTGAPGTTVVVHHAVYDRGGTVLASANSTATALSYTAWVQVRAPEVTAPAGAAYQRLWLTSSGAAGSAWVTGLWAGLAASTEPELVAGLVNHCDDDDPAHGFRLGGGGPQVIASGPAGGYTMPGLYSHALTLTERF